MPKVKGVTRQLKLENGVRAKPVRKASEILEKVETLSDPGLIKFGKSLSGEELEILIDHVYTTQENAKKAAEKVAAVVDPAKKLMLVLGIAKSKKKFLGKSGMVVIGATSKTEIGTATQLAKILKREGKTKLFDSLVTVKIGDTKKFIGLDALGKFVKTETKSYGSVSFKAKK